MLPGMDMLACPNLAVSPEVMQHIVHVESGANPFAIGVVNGHLVRQPKTMGEALATVQMLENKGYNYSLGIAQVNRSNLGHYGLDSYQKAFNACDNLAAGAQILARCYDSARGDWGKAFSCYYSGNFTAGFRDGYVQKVYASINREAKKKGAAGTPPAAPVDLAIPLAVSANYSPSTALAFPDRAALRPVVVYASDSAPYRVALRSMAIDKTAAMMVVSVAGHSPHAETSIPADAMAQHPDNPAYQAALPVTSVLGNHRPLSSATGLGSAMSATANAIGGVFEPQVRGPNDPPIPSAAMVQGPVKPGVDDADLRQERSDAAFIF